jgi:hypothetical protein
MKRNGTFKFSFLFLTVLIIGATQLPLVAQVENNNIISRSELIVDGDWIHSTTANNSVEWSCVNKALTNKCLVYHND